MQRRVVLAIASLAALVAAAACDLNPQPLPPADGNERAVDQPSGSSSSGGFGSGGEATDDTPNTPPSPMAEGGTKDSDGGDAGADATTDANDDGG